MHTVDKDALGPSLGSYSRIPWALHMVLHLSTMALPWSLVGKPWAIRMVLHPVVMGSPMVFHANNTETTSIPSITDILSIPYNA